MRARILASTAALLASGCTALLDFDDCSTDQQCGEMFGVGIVCVENRCVNPSDRPATGTYTDYLVSPCNTLYPADFITPQDDIRDDVILLGALLPATGELGAYGPPIDRAVELAGSEINQVGGVLGRDIAVISCDTATDPEAAKQGAAHLADVVGVPAIIGAAASSITIEVFNKVAKERGVLMVSPASTSPALTDLQDGGLMWRTAPTDAIQGEAIANYLMSNKKFRSIAVIFRDDAYGAGLRDAIHARLCLDETSEFSCTESSFFSRSYGKDTETFDQSEALVDLKTFDPDVIVLIAFLEDGTAFVNLAAAPEFGFTRFIFTDGTKSDELIGAVPDVALCRAIGTNPASPSGTSYQSFAVRYEGKWKKPPGAFNANAYDAMYLLGYAIAAADLPPAELTGAALAGGLERLSAGVEVKVGAGDFNLQTGLLSGDPEATIDLIGASGDLSFDNDTGEAPANIEAWYFDLDAGKVKTLGEIYDAAGVYTDPVFAPECLEDPGDDS